jgi:hypothetical protein
MTLARHEEVSARISAAPQVLFDHLDDQERLAAHMNKPSMMMMGGRMFYEFDDRRGRAVGSVIRMGGTFLWLNLFVEETVVEREPPRRKVWQTQGSPRLIIIGAYRMGFDVVGEGETSRLRVFIDYDLAPGPIGLVLGALFAPIYARWCVKRMADDAKQAFAAVPTATPAGWSA